MIRAAANEPHAGYGSPDYTVLVNSTDAFSDCWTPFFTLLGKYWPTAPRPIVLNTETLSFDYPGVDLFVTRTASLVQQSRPPILEPVAGSMPGRHRGRLHPLSPRGLLLRGPRPV